MNTCVFCEKSNPSLSQDYTLALKSLSDNMYHEVYDHFVKQKSGNESFDRTSDCKVLVRRHDTIPESVCQI